jgi:bifunctional diaminopimelate decarboxylase / aspartate kinase
MSLPRSACSASSKSSTTSTKPEPGATWWRARREELIALLADRDSAYVYDIATVLAQARSLLALPSIARVLYALKANPHPEILRALEGASCGFECVSRAEVERVLQVLPGIECERVLFTPNFAPRDEYRWALAQGFRVTVDNLQLLRAWSPLFSGREIFLRLDATGGRGHHAKVRTGGRRSKFGVPSEEFAELPQATAVAGARVVGLHAHGGSGNFDLAAWLEPARVLATHVARFPGARVLNLGGGLGVPDRPGQAPIDLAALDAALTAFRAEHPGLALWLEPGRFLVAAAGVLLARVTQTKGKGRRRYVGVATGMNSLIRPALYDARHEVTNLTRLDQAAVQTCTVVGPICESGDVLARDCRLPHCEEGDVLLIADAGAYGHAMSSRYNLREPAPELVLSA